MAPSVTVSWTVAEPTRPMAGVRVNVQAVVGLPQFDGKITSPALLAGIRALDGVAETLRTPVPPIVKGNAGELEPPTIVVPCGPVRLGAGIIAREPIASTRP